jgi:N6-L-threonylcarbamoyladenine synthase
MKILGIETSCDETAVCLIEASGDLPAGRQVLDGDFRFEILGNGLASQAVLHAQYGGVFPNLAKREHSKNLVPMLEEALRGAGFLESGSTPMPANVENILEREPELFARMVEYFGNYKKPDVDVIAVTYGPGLEPALWVGVNFAKALCAAWNVPIIGVDHMEGHVILSMMENNRPANFEFPILALLISGGHTELVLSKNFGQYKLIGETRDDAAGEAFDKVARMLELPYPGGPHISRLAKEAREKNVPTEFKLPRPMMNEDNFDFSFSGLKTAVLRMIESEKPSEEKKLQIAREFEDAVCDVLLGKTMRAAEEFGAQTIILGGGVAANTHIRSNFTAACEKSAITLLIPPPEFATDNAIMIALAGYFHALKKEFADPPTLRANGDLQLAETR